VKKRKFNDYSYYHTHNLPQYKEIGEIKGNTATEGNYAFSSTSNHNIDKPHVEVAGSQHILSEPPIFILPSCSCFSWWIYLYVGPIDRTNGIFEKGVEARVLVDNAVDSQAIGLSQVTVTKLQ
jgi:hypothetical protein